jgi:hypothetical protein
MLWIALRPNDPPALRTLRDDIHGAVRGDVLQLERELRDEVARSALGTRQELSHNLATFQGMLLAQHGDVAQRQNEQIDGFRTQLGATQQHLTATLRETTTSLAQQALGARTAQDASLVHSAEQQAKALQRFSDTLNEQLRALSQSNDQRMNEVRVTVEHKLAAIQTDNEKKLEQIRATVDEKLHATLEQRLGESFKQVADRLEQVHRGLGEMQTLARDVGSLSRVLNNVKTRGTLGEVQLAFFNMASLLPHIKSGRLKALAAIPAQRLPELPEVPTLAEQGFPGIGTNAWQGMFAPAATPRPIVDKLHGAVMAALLKPDQKDGLAKQMMAVAVSPSPQEFTELVRRETQAWAEFLKTANIKID